MGLAFLDYLSGDKKAALEEFLKAKTLDPDFRENSRTPCLEAPHLWGFLACCLEFCAVDYPNDAECGRFYG
jgi:hypothetical protein